MALPSSGPISFNNINVELGVSGTTQASLGQASYRTLAGVASGAISMSNFYGKANAFTFTISSTQTNANLRTLAVNAGWDQTTKVIATIASNIYINSNNTGTPALTVNGSFPGGVELINNGFIVGRGGSGGNGGSTTSLSPGGQISGTAGTAGGLALSVSSAITITNNNTVAGGGGGGGGGGWRMNVERDSYGNIVGGNLSGGGGGGGGRTNTFNNTAGGAGGTTDAGGGANGSVGSSGTSASAGSGGAGGYTSGANTYGGAGGAGGGWGAAGSSGGSGSGGNSAGGAASGGAAGGAVSGNSNITWAVTGTRLGTIS